MHKIIAAAIPFALFVVTSQRGAAAAEKSQYWLFNPTPARLMREMTTDRPDITEVPFTVDAGHFQTESTLFGYARSRPDLDGAESDVYDFMYTNLRIGLTNDVELSLVWEPFGLIKAHGEVSPTQSGVGSLDVRLKANLWGNDNFDKLGSAFALLPFIVVPTDADNGISVERPEGGLAAFAQLKLPGKFELGINVAAEAVANEEQRGHHTEYPMSASLSYEWTEKFGTYAEFATVLGFDDPRGDIFIIGAGWTYSLTENLQLDGGMNFGLQAPADRYNPFLGLSMRF
ncbi:Transporter [Hyphomicrobium sp. 1Nfss2.1]|uniref:transporter n=1 Tax=Hyphomicrobium sp. 1Nfss2.1 TaxID=3413936 RepID=UPI003C7D489E